MLMPIFCKFIPKSPYGGKPNEKQGPKAHQEDQGAREVQRKKCKGKRDRKSTRLNSSHSDLSRMPSSA